MKISYQQLSALVEALDTGAEIRWYWDKKNDAVLLYADYDICGVSLEEQGFEGEPDENPDRYIYIEPLESHHGFRNMERYVEGLPDGECQRSLIRALRGRRPFATFKDVLLDFPDKREAWFSFHNDWLTQKAIDFIQYNNLGEIDESTTKPPNS